MMKNGASDFTLKLFKDESNKMQQVLNSLSNTFACRLKYYTHQDIASFILFHQMKVSQSGVIVYCLAGKFRTMYLESRNMAKVFEKNHHTLIMHLNQPGFGFQNF